jgi:2-hydroxyacyl-CoA lyase 1
MRDDELPMSYYRAFAEIKRCLPRDVFLVSEGANTMVCLYLPLIYI